MRLLALSIIWICAIEILRERDEDVRTKSGEVASLKFETVPSFQEQKKTGENFSEKMMLPEFISAGEKKEGKNHSGKNILQTHFLRESETFMKNRQLFGYSYPRKYSRGLKQILWRSGIFDLAKLQLALR